MIRSVVLPSSVILTVITLITLAQLGKASARSLGLKQGYWSTVGDVSKRNSWWSKKSVEPSPEYNTLDQEPTYGDTEREATAEGSSQPLYSSIFICYIKECVPKFVQCSQSSATQDEYSECKKRHEICGMLCGSMPTEEPLI